MPEQCGHTGGRGGSFHSRNHFCCCGGGGAVGARSASVVRRWASASLSTGCPHGPQDADRSAVRVHGFTACHGVRSLRLRLNRRRGGRAGHPPPGVPSIYSIVPPNDGSALRHGHHFEPVDFVIDHGRGRHDAYSAGSCQRTYARACGCRQRPRRHREELIEPERGWSGREAFVTMMQTADLGQGNDRSGPGRLNGSSIRCVLAERQVGP